MLLESSSPSNRLELAIVVLNYRTPQMTIECLETLETQVANLDRARVYIVDNLSGDNSCHLISSAICDRGWSDWCEFIQSPVNGGFAAGNNLAIERAELAGGYDFVLLLNSDTLVREGAISELMFFVCSDEKIGIVGSRLEDPDGTPQVSAFRFPSVRSSFESGIGLGVVSRLFSSSIIAMPISEQPCRADWVCGASFLIRQKVVEQIGMLDAHYFMYFEETDYCLAANRAGFETWYVPKSRVVHLVGQASGISSKDEGARQAKRRPAYWFESRRRYLVKNHGMFLAAFADLAWLIGYSMRCVRSFVTRKSNHGPRKLWADSLRHSVFVSGFKIK